MARVVALIPDLLFGSQVQGMLRAAGLEVELVGDRERMRAALPGASLLVVDLTDPVLDGPELVRELAGPRGDTGGRGEVAGGRDGDAGDGDGDDAAGEPSGLRTLGFYAHVDPQTRERALAAGFDQVVPRSRLAREGAELVRRLLAERSV